MPSAIAFSAYAIEGMVPVAIPFSVYSYNECPLLLHFLHSETMSCIMLKSNKTSVLFCSYSIEGISTAITFSIYYLESMPSAVAFSAYTVEGMPSAIAFSAYSLRD